MGMLFSEHLQHGKAVPPRHFEVTDHRIEAAAPELGFHPIGASDRHDLRAGLSERFSYQIEDFRLVVYDQVAMVRTSFRQSRLIGLGCIGRSHNFGGGGATLLRRRERQPYPQSCSSA